MLQWVISFLEQYGVWGLVLLTFLDSFISPIPPEVLFIPLSLVDPKNSLWLAFITVIISVFGGIVGYGIGIKGGRPLLNKLFAKEKIKKAENIMQEYGVMAVLIAAFTPIPYKIVTITSGALGLSLKKLIFWSTLGRSARFFLEAALIMILGQAAKSFLEGTSFTILTILIGGLLLVIYVFWMIIKRRRQSEEGGR